MAAPKPFVDPLAGKNPTARQSGGGGPTNPTSHGQASDGCFIVCLSTVGNALSSTWHKVDKFMQDNSLWFGLGEIGLGILSMTPVGWLADTTLILGTVISVATTVDSCVDKQWGSCAIGVASLRATYGGYKMGKAKDYFSDRASEVMGFLSGVRSSFYGGMSKIAGGVAQMFNGVSVGLSSISTAAGNRLNDPRAYANP